MQTNNNKKNKTNHSNKKTKPTKQKMDNKMKKTMVKIYLVQHGMTVIDILSLILDCCLPFLLLICNAVQDGTLASRCCCTSSLHLRNTWSWHVLLSLTYCMWEYWKKIIHNAFKAQERIISKHVGNFWKRSRNKPTDHTN